MTPTQTRFSCALICKPSVSRARGSGTAGSGGRGFGGFLGALLRLGLRGRFDRGLTRHRFLDHAGIAKKFRHSLGRQRANPEPMPDALLLQGDAIGVITLQHWIVGTELLDKSPVARAARVGDHNRIERPLLGAAASQPDFQGQRRTSSYTSETNGSPCAGSIRARNGLPLTPLPDILPAKPAV